MKKLNYKTIFLLLLTISSICLGNIQINKYTKKLEPTKITRVEPSPSAGPANLGAWIIVAGDKDSHKHIELIKYGCNRVYEALINRGFAPDDICYLGPIYGDISPYQTAYSLRYNIQWAIEEWAPTRGVGPAKGVGLYLFDHGGINGFAIPGTNLHDTYLNSYLDNLEASTGCNRIVLIYEACHAGSFINPISKNNRIIVTSTDIDHNAHGNGDGTWAVFSEGFWSNILMCRTIGEAFASASAHVITNGYGNYQFPWIDDNHDEVGHETGVMGSLPNGGDGGDALNVWIGTGPNCPATSITFFPYKIFMSLFTSFKPIWVVIDTDSVIEKVYARIIPPNWTPAEAVSDDEGTTLVKDMGVLVCELQDHDGDGNFTGFIEVGRNPDFWNSNGDYKVNFNARSQDGTIADIELTYITLNNDGEAPPDTTPPKILILNPVSNANVSDVINITAEGDDDQALDKIQLLIDGVLLKEEAMPPYLPYPQAIYNLTTTNHINGMHNLTAIAIDKANNVKQTSIVINIQNGLQIPGFQITTLFIGSLIGVLMIYIVYIRKNRTRKIT